MPSRLRQKQDIPVDRLELDGGDWVRVRRWLTARDVDEINHMLVRVNVAEEASGQDESAKTEIANRTTVLQILTEWGGPGFCQDEHDENYVEGTDDHQHRPVEITFENVSGLHAQDLRKIVNHVSKTNHKSIAPTGDGHGGPFPKATPVGVS